MLSCRFSLALTSWISKLQSAASPNLHVRPSGCVRPSGWRLGSLPNFQVIEVEKAPQVGLEPTTLRLTEGFQVVAGSCGLLLTHSWFCFYGFFGVADFDNVLL